MIDSKYLTHFIKVYVLPFIPIVGIWMINPLDGRGSHMIASIWQTLCAFVVFLTFIAMIYTQFESAIRGLFT